ncbi:hypothetical protein FI667_g8339, partial [Globisporangium splendens]
MSWQNTWGTVRATNAKACALYCEIADVGKTIESSKKRVIWRLKVEDGREFEIILTHSLASGKKILRVDGIIKYTSQSLSFGDWDHVFNLPGGYVVHIIIKPSVELNDMYDLIIDGMSFRRLPDRLDPNRAKSSGGVASATSSSARTGSGGAGGSRTNSYTYNYSNGGSGYTRPSSRESSFSPWPCSRCTLVNEKPLAPICEACGAPKPDYISPEDRQRVRETVEHRSAAPVSRTAAPKSTGKQRSQSNKASEPDFFSTPNASAPDNSNDFGAFGSDPFAASSSSVVMIAVTAVGFYSGTANMPPGGYYQQSPGMMQQPMYNTTVGAGYGMAPPSGGFGAVHNSAAYGTHFGAPQQQFMTQMQQQPGNNAFPSSKPNALGSDPFATLS